MTDHYYIYTMVDMLQSSVDIVEGISNLGCITSKIL